MSIGAINIAPLGNLNRPGETIVFIFQDGRSLEEYVEEFTEICHLARCDDITLMEGFR